MFIIDKIALNVRLITIMFLCVWITNEVMLVSDSKDFFLLYFPTIVAICVPITMINKLYSKLSIPVFVAEITVSAIKLCN